MQAINTNASNSSELLINVTPQETRVALIINGIVQEVMVERAAKKGLVGNIYKGKVVRILPGMQAVFVEIGLQRTGFLHASDITNQAVAVVQETPNGQGSWHDMDSMKKLTADEHERMQMGINTDIKSLVIDGQDIIVQVLKDPIGSKGARLTTNIAIPACFMVLLPFTSNIGISQRIEDPSERDRLRKLIQGISSNFSNGKSPQGYIIRTAAESANEEMLANDDTYLQRIWEDIKIRIESANVPACVYEDLPLSSRALRELRSTDLERIRIDSKETLHNVVSYAEKFLPEMLPCIEHYNGDRPIFDLYAVEEEIQNALKRRVQLKSGGYLIIDQTEAMTTIDVNTGGFVGQKNLEETTFKTNMEAAQSISRQLRLRNLGGIIIIDFIDMKENEHKSKVLQTLERYMQFDPNKTFISSVSPLGLVEMTRKRTRESLGQVVSEPCPVCAGRGRVKTPETVCYEIFREIIRQARQFETKRLLVLSSPEVIETMIDNESENLSALETFLDSSITLQAESTYSREYYDVVFM